MTESLNKRLQELQTEMKETESNWEKEKQEFRSTFTDLLRKAEQAKENNYKTILRNQNLREK